MHTINSPATIFPMTGIAATLSASTTQYCSIYSGGLNATETNRQNVIGISGTFRWAYIATSNSQPGTGSLVFTLRVNNASTSIVVTIAAGSAAGTFSDTTNTANVSAGQVAGWMVTNNATSTSAAITGGAIYLHGNDSKWAHVKSVIVSSGTNITYAGSSGTLYEYLIGSGTSTTENARQVLVPMAGTLKYVGLKTASTQPGTGSLVRTLRKNESDTSIVITIAANSAQGVFTDVSNSVTVAAGDRLNWKLINSATTASCQQIANSIFFYS